MRTLGFLRSVATASAGLMLAAPFGQAAADQASTEQSEPAAEFSFRIPNLWMAGNFRGNWIYTPPEGDLGIVSVHIPTAADASDATIKAWEKLGEDPEHAPRLANPLSETKGWSEFIASNPAMAFDEQQILRGLAFRQGTGWMVLIVRPSGNAPNSRRLMPIIVVDPKPASVSSR